MSEEGGRRRRPKGVWLVSIFYTISALWTLLSSYLIFSGAIPLNREQETYYASITVVDWIITGTLSVISLSAAVSLFLLRKLAATLFMAALILSVLYSIYQIVAKNLLRVVAPGGFVGMLLGFALILAVTLYAQRLARRGVLS